MPKIQPVPVLGSFSPSSDRRWMLVERVNVALAYSFNGQGWCLDGLVSRAGVYVPFDLVFKPTTISSCRAYSQYPYVVISRNLIYTISRRHNIPKGLYETHHH